MGLTENSRSRRKTPPRRNRKRLRQQLRRNPRHPPHIFQADRLWWKRFSGDPHAPLVLPGETLTVTDLKAQWPTVISDFVTWLRSQEDPNFEEHLFWRNTRGEDKNDVKYKILLHIVNHATYHRGQVITMIKQAGGEVVSTDLVYYPGM